MILATLHLKKIWSVVLGTLQRQQFLFLFPFYFFFFKFTPVCNLSWIANHIKILIFIGALFFHKFVIVSLVINLLCP
jgi:hypothetical protein